MTEESSLQADALAQLFDRSIVHGGDPYPFYERARALAAVFFSRRFEMWFVTRYDDIVAVLRDTQTFSSEERSIKPKTWPAPVAEILAGYGHLKHLGNTDPPAHTRLRQLLNQVFTRTRLAQYEPVIRQTADELIAQLGDGYVDLISRFCYPFTQTVIFRILGLPEEDFARCAAWSQSKAALDFAAETLTVDQQCDAARDAMAFVTYCRELVERRIAQPGGDLISELAACRAHGHEPLSATEIADLLPILIFAGHETTANAIGSLMVKIVSEPGLLRQMTDDPALIPPAVEEILRVDSPALGFVRRATRDVEIAGVRIPEGGKLFLLYGSGNHDERYWTDSGRFDPTRPHMRNHLAFGHGIHFCVGAALARLEARIGIEQLLASLPDLRLSHPTEPPIRTANLVVRGVRQLDVVWSPAGTI